MKQLSSLGGRRHVFFRGQRRMRALGERLEAEELGHFSYYGGKLHDFSMTFLLEFELFNIQKHFICKIVHVVGIENLKFYAPSTVNKEIK